MSQQGTFAPPRRSFDWIDAYLIGYRISWVLIFVVCWIYCIAEYGFLVGVGIGWLPSAIAAAVISAFWPLIVVLIFFIIAYAGSH